MEDDGLSLEGIRSLEWGTGKMMKLHPSIQKPAIYVRECYSLLFSDIKDLKSLGFLYLHVSGDPGIGKSCFLWYVLVRLLNDAEEKGSAIIVELVEKKTRNTLEFAPNGSVSTIASPATSKHYNQPGTWLLTDQAYVGDRAALGTTVLFASLKQENWDEARRTMDPARFRRMFMPPFSPEELQIVFFSTRRRSPRYIRQFWTRYYLFGPVMRWYNIPIDTAFSELCGALIEVVDTKVYDPTRLRRTTDNGLHCHRLFSHWPTEDFSKCAYITFVSEWAARSFATRCYTGEVDILSLDPQLRSAAGFLFQRYAHCRLSRGGDFADIEGRGVVHLEPRRMKFFNGNKLELAGDSHLYYLRPNSLTFPVIDGFYVPDVCFQISIAKSRKATMPGSVFSDFASRAQELPFGVRVANTEMTEVAERPLWAVLVTKPAGLQVEVETTEEVQEGGPARKRVRRVTRKKQELTQDHLQKAKCKTILVPFQMTIAIGEEQDSTVNYHAQLTDIFQRVRDRMVGDEDPDAVCLRDLVVNDIGDQHIDIIMRQGHGCAQYNEGDDDEFGVWIEADRVLEGLVYTTKVKLECTRGTFLDGSSHELNIFINEHVETDFAYDEFARLVLPRAEATVAVCEFDEDMFSAELVSPTEALVTVTSSRRDCKCFCLEVASSGMSSARV